MIPESTASTAFRPWRSIGWWLAGLFSFAFVATVTAFGVVSYRARMQAALVAELKRNGASVTHSVAGWMYSRERDEGQPPPITVHVPRQVREFLGDDFFDDVVAVHAARYEPKLEELFPLTDKETESVCQLCRQLPTLRSFSIKSDSFQLSDIASWPHFGRLERLELMSDNVTDADLATVGGLSRLRHLHLASSQVTDAGLQHLAALTELRELGIESTTVSDAGLKHLAGLDKIWSLRLLCTQIGDEGVLSLAPSQLQVVVLKDCQVGDRGLSHLVSAGGLNRLFVEGTRITDASLADIDKCQYLIRLDLVRSNVTDAGLRALAGLHVQFIHLDGTPITDEGLRHLGSLGRDKKISDIYLRDTQVTGTGAEHLLGYQYIGELDLSGAPLRREGIERLAKTKVSRLNVSRTPIGDEELLLFADMEGSDGSIRIDVRQTKVTAQGIRRLEDEHTRYCIKHDRYNGMWIESDFKSEDFPPSEITAEAFLLPDGIPVEGNVPPPSAVTPEPKNAEP